ncbi:MAG: hypothetical protein R3F14_40300 [Polyangiaceae bacterium]
METRPTISRVVMFKHGVAYLERSGPAQGSFELRFRVEEMNDVLKSLAVWVAEGDARLLSVGFDAPEDPDIALAQRGLLLGAGSALDALLASLRGRTVEVDVNGALIRGEVLGVQERAGAHMAKLRSLLVRTAGDVVSILDLDRAASLRLVEQTSRDRLDFLVDKSQAATSGEIREVRVNLEGQAKDLRVAYVIPAPMWRVSYRIVREGDAATLMALAIVHNPADEDLHDIDLTLTTGQPVSFVIDLYHPRNVERAVLEEETRAAAPPTRFERAMPVGGAMPAPPPAALRMYGGPPGAPGGPQGFGPPPAPTMADSFGSSAEGASAGVERGELFEYRVASKLSIARGGSAMVPLAATRVPATRQRIWRDGAGPNPDLVLSFTNETGLVLEEGPAVLYDDGVYAGESMLPYSARGVPVKMAFAKDLAVRVQRRVSHATITAGVRLEKSGLIEEQRQELTQAIEAENDHDEPVDLLVELPRVTGRQLSPEGAQPVEETLQHRRFEMKIEPHAKAEIKVIERWSTWRSVAVESVTAIELDRWMRDRFLDEATVKALSGVLAHRARSRELAVQRGRVEAAQKQAYAKQTKLSEQLAVLKETGPEGELRLRYVKELAVEQDRVNAAEQEMRRIDDAIAAEDRAAADELQALLAKPATPA